MPPLWVLALTLWQSICRVIGDDHIFITHAWPVVILIAGFVGALFGSLVGLPSFRLKHLYLAIATLSFQMIFQWIINIHEILQPGADNLRRQGFLVHR